MKIFYRNLTSFFIQKFERKFFQIYKMKLHHHQKIPPSFEEYPFSDRNIFYGTEYYEPSPDEINAINETKSTPVSPHKSPANEGVVKCIIDTDIGTDFDDTLALLYALNLDNLDILGITTNYGPTQLRSSIVHKIVDSYMKKHPERKPIPIISGANFQIGTHRPIFIKGNEGKPFYNDEEIQNFLNVSNWEKENQTEAAEFIAKTVNSNPIGTIKLISIGIMTNIALSFKLHPEIIQKVKEMVVMGGGNFITKKCQHFTGKFSIDKDNWDKDIKVMSENLPENKKDVLNFVCGGNPVHLFPNHNFSGDTMAAVYAFCQNQIPIKIICHSVTSKFWLSGDPIDFFHKKADDARRKNVLDDDVYEVVGLLMEEWFKKRNGQNGQCPHDPLTIHEALFGGSDSPVYYVNGTLIVHKWAAFSTFIPNENGKHSLSICVYENDINRFLDFLGKKLTIDCNSTENVLVEKKLNENPKHKMKNCLIFFFILSILFWYSLMN